MAERGLGGRACCALWGDGRERDIDVRRLFVQYSFHIGPRGNKDKLCNANVTQP